MQSIAALVPIRKLAVAGVTAGVVYVLKLAGVHYASSDVTTAVNAFLPLVAAYVVKDPAVQKVATDVEHSALEKAIVEAAQKAIKADPALLGKLEQQLLGVLSTPAAAFAPSAKPVATLSPVPAEQQPPAPVPA